MREDPDDTDSQETEKRLEEVLNAEDRAAEPNAADPADPGRNTSTLTTLKSVVLSMEWEINDVILTEFVQELIRLKSRQTVIRRLCRQDPQATYRFRTDSFRTSVFPGVRNGTRDIAAA